MPSSSSWAERQPSSSCETDPDSRLLWLMVHARRIECQPHPKSETLQTRQPAAIPVLLINARRDPYQNEQTAALLTYLRLR